MFAVGGAPSLPLGRRGIVARSNPRLVAGVGIVSLGLLFGGSTAAAVADPGHGHSGGGNNSAHNNKGGNGPSAGHGQAGVKPGRGNTDDDGSRGNGNANGGNDSPNPGVHGGNVDVGNDGGPTSGHATGNDSVAAPTATVGSGRSAVASDGDIAPTPETAGADGATGPDAVPGPNPAGRVGSFQAPRVTFGNGRTPGMDIDDPPSRWQAPVAEPAPAVLPPAPPPPVPAPSHSWVDRIATPPEIATELGVAPTADLSDPLWGIAGLLLIPAAGAALGYRQARATQAAERLRRG
jgi:hypothetical protein